MHELAARLEDPAAPGEGASPTSPTSPASPTSRPAPLSPLSPLAILAARLAIDERRAVVLAEGPTGSAEDGSSSPSAPEGRSQLERPLEERAQEILRGLNRRSLRRVINATGVILHTNLGRAPLGRSAVAAVNEVAAGYSNLELDLTDGTRGSRQDHVARLLRELTGAEAGLAVNNGAGAVLLAVTALAGPGRSLLVSRGQAVEIGGGFRIPEVVAQSGARLVEVGTTNRTRLDDYQRAIEQVGENQAAILRVHPSNFRSLGFVEQVPVATLCELGVPVIDDVGSGRLAAAPAPVASTDHDRELEAEPAVRESVAAGAALVCFSGDKLLGGPQAGLLVGRAAAIERATRHPLARALRIDKLSLTALEATLMLYREPRRAWSELPVLAMLAADESMLRRRARSLGEALGDEAVVVRSTARVGGGALPLTELEGPAVALQTQTDPETLSRRLREGEPPVVARVADGRVLLDPRTVTDEELPLLVGAARAALGELGES